MGRNSAAAQGAAFFLVAIVGSSAQACENCERAPTPAAKTVRLDVTAAVDTATSFVIKAWRTLQPAYTVLVAEADEIDASPPAMAEYALFHAEQVVDSDRRRHRLPAFQHRSAWELTYRDEGPDEGPDEGSQGARPFEVVEDMGRDAERGTDVTLDDSWVLGLRFELAYGWKR